MRRVTTILVVVIGLNGPAWAAGLKTVAPAECKPAMADYALMWWANGWNQHAPIKPAIVCIQTGRYGLELEVEKVQLLRFGGIARPKPYEAAAKQESDFLDALPPGNLELAVQEGQRRYTCREAAVDQKDWLNFPVRMIENGRFLQRCDLLQLRFADDAGHFLEAEGRLEIVAWPERLTLILELTPRINLEDASLILSIGSAGQTKLKRTDRSEPGLLAAGRTHRLALSVGFGASPPPGPGVVVTVSDHAQAEAPLLVEYDPDRGCHRVTLPKWHWSVVQEPDHLDRFRVSLKNSSAAEQAVPLMFDAEEAIPGITGFTPMLRDAEGFPTGIPVQLSKNWHRQEKRRLLYEGPWFHGCTLLRIPARSELECEFDITWARWGGVPAASHSQLCLIGWGWNQVWDQAAIGSWGESICYEPDAIQQRCRIDDVRPLMVWGIGGEKTQWSWTHNVGGGDFLVYYNERGEYVPLTGMKTAYQAHGPNLTHVTYSGISADRHIRAVLDVSTPRSDDLNRAYHRFRYEILKPTPFSRLAFYQLGSDNYHWHQYNLMARGNESGLVEEWKPNRGGKRYDCRAIPCAGAVPWFSLHDAIPQDNLKPVKGAWANRGLVIRSWKARLGGKEAPPYASVFGTEAGRIPSANLELSAPPAISRLEPGDFVEAQLELLILPMSADDYYGPNQNLRSSLGATANTWKPVHRQAVSNHLKLHVLRGALLDAYPPVLKVDAMGSAELEIIGGVGYMPLSFCNLKSYRNPRLVANVEGRAQPIDQSVHGNDFWQTDYEPAQGKWRVTYNIPLDSPTDTPRVVRLRFESGALKGSLR